MTRHHRVLYWGSLDRCSYFRRLESPRGDSHWAAESIAGPNVVVRPVREEMSSRSEVIFPFPGARMLQAEALAKELKEEIRIADQP